jgi:hypothetical protein
MFFKPAKLAARLKQVFLVDPPEGIALLHNLLEETIALVETNMPGVDVSRSYEAIRWQRKPLENASAITAYE